MPAVCEETVQQNRHWPYRVHLQRLRNLVSIVELTSSREAKGKGVAVKLLQLVRGLS